MDERERARLERLKRVDLRQRFTETFSVRDANELMRFVEVEHTDQDVLVYVPLDKQYRYFFPFLRIFRRK